jgi:hypothetical protein
MNNKIPDALKELYRLVLKDGVRVESFMDGHTLNVWTRGTDYNGLQYWAEFNSMGSHFIERPLRLSSPGWITSERIGLGIINPNAILKLQKMVAES